VRKKQEVGRVGVGSEVVGVTCEKVIDGISKTR
jgi:hypothetical protein